ncbi:MAG: polysaccharide deacetylase family protein [Cyclobacteriaceae bacterium]
MIYFYGRIFRLLYPSLEWRVSTLKKELFLTFDDGPIPGITEFILDQLAIHNAKATFFCVGENITKHPLIYKRILNEGHRVGNHTYNHLKGNISKNLDYFENIALFDNIDTLSAKNNKPLFRPPYGKIKRSQIKFLKVKYRLIVWEILSGDFLPNMTPDKCLSILHKYARKGSIIVLHDNIKTENIVQEVLPVFLKEYKEKGYDFLSL